MMEFHYEALNRHGNRVSGSLQANDRTHAVGLLNEQGFTVVRIARGKSGAGSAFSEWAPLSFPLPVLASFSRQFAALLKSGFDPVSGLKVMEDQTSNPLLRQVIRRINHELATEPKPLAGIMKKYRKVFPPLYVNLIAASETGGFLDRVLTDIADFYDKEIEWRRRLQGQTLYMKMTFIVYLAAMFFFVFILPQIGGLRLISPGFFTLGLLILGIYFAYVIGSRSREGHAIFHGIAVHLPLIGKLYRSISLARFFNIASLQVEAGVPLHETLTTAARASGDYRVQIATNRILKSLDSGQTLNEAFKQAGFFTRADVGMVAVGEAAGDTGQMMERVSNFYALDAETQAANLAAFVRVAMPLIMGAIVLLAAVSFWSHYIQTVMSVGED
ncbi:MAG: type II secretion system F family protein [bacterium]